MTGTNCDLFKYNQSRSYLNHLVHACDLYVLASLPVTVDVYECIRFPQKSSMGRHRRAVRICSSRT
jgi:hypothetical protein